MSSAIRETPVKNNNLQNQNVTSDFSIVSPDVAESTKMNGPLENPLATSKSSHSDGGSTSNKANDDEEVAESIIKQEEENLDQIWVIAALVERLSFFFSDANLRQDIFMRRLLTKDPKNVSIEVLLKFNSIKQHTTDPDILIRAIKSDRLAGKIELTDDSKAVKRVKPFTMDQMDENIPLTIVVGNLPVTKTDDGKEIYAVKYEEIRNLFEQYGEVSLVKFRYSPKEKSQPREDVTTEDSPKASGKKQYVPCGSALVEFLTEEAAKVAAEDVLTQQDGILVEPKRRLELGGQRLSAVMLKESLAEIKKRKAEEGEREKDEESHQVDESYKNGENRKDRDSSVPPDWKPGCVIKLLNLPRSCTREALFEAMSKCLEKTLDEIKEMKVFADYSRGQTEGALQFQEPNGPVDVMLKKLQSGDVEIEGVKISSATLLEGEDEKKYWHNFMEFKRNSQRYQKGESNAGNRGGGRFRNKKRRH